jgi:hypothetical protein
MKTILSLIISAVLIVSGFGQTRNVLVGTNNVVVQPTNFWSADVTNARSGLGLGSAATNAASAFQPASSILSNLVSGGALTFSNITIGITNVTGLQTSLDGKLGTNPTLAIANISNLQTTLDGKLGTNPTLQISNIAALQTALDGKLSGSFPIAISNVSGLQTSLDGKLATNPTLQISNIAALQTNLDSKLSLTGSAANLTNFPTVALASNITGTAALATNVTGVVALVNGGTGATNATGARTALGVGSSDVFVGLTNLGTGTGQGFASTPYILGSTNSTTPNNAVLALDSSGVRSVAGLTLAALTNTDNAAFRTAIGLDTAATNPATAFQPSSSVLTNLAASNGGGLTNITASNVTGTIAISNGGSGATTAGGARTNLGLILPALTNTDVTNFRTAIGLGTGDVVQFQSVWARNNLAVRDGTNDPIVYIGDDIIETSVPIEFLTNTANATTRTNLGLGWTALTNSNAGTGLVSVNTNGEVVSPTNFWQAAPISTTVQYQTNVVSTSTNAATNSRNLFLYSLATSVSGITNTITLPTNPATTFEGDRATIIHGASTTNAVTAVRQLGAATNIITLNQYEEAVLFIYRSGAWGLADNISYVEPIYFSGTNAAANAATSRTNLGLGATWLTNANVTNFRTAIGLGATNDVSLNSVTTSDGVALTTYGVSGGGFNGELDFEENQFFAGDGDWNFSGSGVENMGIIGFFSATNAAVTRTNLGLGATWLTNTNATNFRTAIGLGATNDVNFQSITASGVIQAGLDGTNTVSVNIGNYGFEIEGNKTNGLISFIGTNLASAFRSDIGLPLQALTNTNNANFQAAVFATNAAPTNSANVNGIGFNTAVAWMEVTVSTNGTNHSFRIPLFR